EGTEQIQLHNDASLARLRHEILQPSEVGLVPSGQVEFVSAIRVTRRLAARPWTDEAARSGRERIAGNVKGAKWLGIGAGKAPREVQTVPGQRVEILHVIEIKIQHRAVMLAGSDQHGRLTPEQEVMRIGRVQRKWPGRSGGGRAGLNQ